MSRVGVAFRAFFKALFEAEAAQRIEQALTTVSREVVSDSPVPVKPAEPAKSSPAPPSDALLLLAALQREARLVDFLKENLAAYSDEQIGAAMREVHRDSQKVLERVFGLQPVVSQSEGATVDVPAGFDAVRYRLTGNVAGQGPCKGELQHPGWVATKCELPTFTGPRAAANVIAPAEIEIP